MIFLPIPSRCAWLPIAASILANLLVGVPSRAAEARLPSEAEAMGILRTVCPGQIKKVELKSGTDYGCGGCPSLTSFAGADPSNGKDPDFDLRQVLEGSFTRPGASEMLAEFFGCEPHVYNFGGTILLEKAGDNWRRVRYMNGIIGLMRTYPRLDGRDIVLDQAGYTGQGISTGSISIYDFSVKPDPSVHELLRVEDTSGNACQSERVTLSYFDKIDYPDLNGDGKPDLRVTVRWGTATVPARVRANCGLDFKPPKPPAYTIDFIFDGKSFHVAPGSAATLRKVAARD